MPSAISRFRQGARLASGARLQSPQIRFLVLMAFLALVFVTGGGARSDITSLVVLRPLSFLMLGYAAMGARNLKRALSRAPILLAVTLTVLLLVQLIPMPPELWTQLPGRGFISEIETDVGMVHGWRPLSLSPSRTLNALFAMGVPLTVGFLATDLRAEQTKRLVGLLILLGAASALLGFMQIIGPTRSGFYTYRITNLGSAVGLFANRNHHAVFLAALFPLIGYLLLDAHYRGRRQSRPILFIGMLGIALFFLPMILATGSRAGTILALVAIIGTAILWYVTDRYREQTQRPLASRFVVSAGLLVFTGMALLAFANSRTPGIDRLFKESLDSEMRFRALPYIWHLAKTYFPVGSGFGSFYLAYYAVEPRELLQTMYLNQAHDDLIQFVVEGGLPAALLLVAGLGWFLWSGWRCWREFHLSAKLGMYDLPSGIFAWLSLAILLVAGLFDYPLRTPSLMAVTMILALFIERRKGAGNEPARRT